MRLVEHIAHGLGQPVRLHAAAHFVHQFVVADVMQNLLSRVISRKKTRSPFHLQHLLGITKVIVRKVRKLHSACEVVCHAQFARLRSDGRHHDDAIGSTRTVKGRGGSILQDGHALDAVDVHIVDFLHAHLKAVEDEDGKVRVVRQIRTLRAACRLHVKAAVHTDTALAADGKLRQVVRVRTPQIGFLQTEGGFESLQGGDGILIVRLQKLVFRHHGGISRERIFLQLLIARHDHLVHHLRIFLHRHIDVGAFAHTFFHVFHAYHGKQQGVALCRHIQRIVSVKVSSRACLCAFHQD